MVHKENPFALNNYDNLSNPFEYKEHVQENVF